MVSADDGKDKEDTGKIKAKGQIPLHVSSSQRALIVHEIPEKRRQDAVPGIPSPIRFLEFSRIAADKDNISRAVPPSASNHRFGERLNDVFARKLDWESIKKMCRTWIRNPMNMALFIWITCVAVSGAILFLVMTGMLNSAIPDKHQREVWFEVNNQILNALFTLMCLYQHPKRCYHLILLCRWRPEDVSKLRKIYCKDGAYKPHEWAHMMVVVLLLHLNCVAQYALCGLNLGYRRSNRPALGVAICISIAIAAPAAAGVYTILSPLGKEYYHEPDEESQAHEVSGQSRRASLEKKFSFAIRDEHRVVEKRPRWKGGVLDFWDDISLSYLSMFCSFCVFGWNMERLGFGNMYVHIATFLLFCMAPFWIFNLAAVNIDDDTVRGVLVGAGIVLCVFGLFYGGFWRIQMRKRFNLPENKSCCGNPAATDCALWLCCCWCSLAQEVRTANFYDIVEDKFCRKEMDGYPQLMSPSPHETQADNSGPSSPRRPSKHSSSPDSRARDEDETLTPPTPPSIQR